MHLSLYIITVVVVIAVIITTTDGNSRRIIKYATRGGHIEQFARYKAAVVSAILPAAAVMPKQ